MVSANFHVSLGLFFLNLSSSSFIAAAADLDLDRVRSADRQGRVDSVEVRLFLIPLKVTEKVFHRMN